MQINTANGPKSPGEALEMFKQAKLPAGALLGIYTQLLSSDRAAEATDFVNKNGNKFNEKIQRKAKEQASGRPIGAKRITSMVQALEILKSAGSGARMHITFSKDCGRHAIQVASLVPRRLQFDDGNAIMFITSCVVPSGRWEGITRTYTVTLKASTEYDLEQVAEAFAAAVESVELISTTIERVGALQSNIMDSLLKENPDLFYDEQLFRNACAKINYPGIADLWMLRIKGPNPTMAHVLESIPLMHKLPFLEAYIACFNAVMNTVQV